MKKKLKNIEKLIVLIFISFTVVFTLMMMNDYGGIARGLVAKAKKNEILNMSQEELESSAKYFQEYIEEQFGSTNSETNVSIANVYQQYPAGTFAFLLNISQSIRMSELLLESFIAGILIGIGIYLFMDTEKKSIPIMLFIYVIGLVLLGFVEGLENTGNSLIDKWQFPTTYFLPGTLFLAFILALRQVKRQVLANEFNRKLKEKQQEKAEDPKEQTILQRTQKTREKMAEIGSEVIIIVIMLIIAIAILFA